MSELEQETDATVDTEQDEPLTDPETGDVREQGSATPTPEPAPEPEPEPEPAQPVGLSEREFEQAAKKLDRAVARYKEQVQAFIEETGQSLIQNLMDLEHCPGYIFHPKVMPLNDDQVAFGRAILDLPIEPAFPQDPEARECPTCEGWGRVKTGSKVAGQNVVNCQRCLGRGFLSSRSPDALAPPPPGGNGDGPASVLTEAEQTDEDAWGTPRSHPDWGKSPQYRSPNWQAELDAYKAGEPAPVV